MKLFLLIVLLIIIIVLLLIFGGFGFGFGFGEKGDGEDKLDGSGASVSVQVGEEGTENKDTAADIQPERMVEYADVTVTGNSYLYESAVTELDELINKLDTSESVVRITDEGATQNAMEDLINALEQKDISYIMSDDSKL